MRFLFGIIFFLLPFQTQWILREGMILGEYWEYGTIGIYVTDLILLLAVIASLRARAKQSRQCQISDFTLRHGGSTSSPHSPGLGLRICGIAGFLLWTAASSLWAFDSFVVLRHTVWVIEAVFVAWVVATATDGQRRWVINGFIAGAVFQAGVGLWQFFNQTTIPSALFGWAVHDPSLGGTSVIEVGEERWLRAYGGLPHPNVLGGWMAVAIVIALYEYSRSLSKSGIMRRVLFFCSLVLLSGGLAVSFSRSAWIALAMGILVMMLFLAFRHPGLPRIRSDSGQAGMTRDLLYACVVIFLSFSAVLLSYRSLLTTRLQTTARLEQQSLTERARGYQDATALVKEHPLLGVGIGNFTAAIATKDAERPIWSIQPVHNVFLLILAEIGMVGFVVMILLFVILLEIRNWKLEIYHPILYSLLAIGLMLALFDHYLWSLHSGLLLSGFTVAVLLHRPPS